VVGGAHPTFLGTGKQSLPVAPDWLSLGWRPWLFFRGRGKRKPPASLSPPFLSMLAPCSFWETSKRQNVEKSK